MAGQRVGLVILLVAASCPGCRRDDQQAQMPIGKVTVYCSVDEVFARGVLDKFQAETGIDLSTVFDSEAGKTTGLVNRIISEAQAGRPRADVFWSSELFNTILLARQSVLEPYDSPAAADIPARFRDPQHRWTALAARARVIAFDPKSIPPDQVPTRWEDIAAPEWARQTAIANPLFGTTRGHVAALFATWGPERGRKFLTELRDGGVSIVDGNSTAVRAVISGQVKLALTDSDDVWVAQRSGASIDLRYPDMGGGGTFLIPCSVAIVKGGPNGEVARKLVDYLVSAKVERLLAESSSRNVPVREALREELNMPWPAESKIDFAAVADAMPEAIEAAREILLR